MIDNHIEKIALFASVAFNALIASITIGVWYMAFMVLEGVLM